MRASVIPWSIYSNQDTNTVLFLDFYYWLFGDFHALVTLMINAFVDFSFTCDGLWVPCVIEHLLHANECLKFIDAFRNKCKYTPK